MFNSTPDDLDMHVIYDVSHNIAKIEEHVSVHRKLSLVSILSSRSYHSPCLFQIIFKQFRKIILNHCRNGWDDRQKILTIRTIAIVLIGISSILMTKNDKGSDNVI